jgi:hypothetical protein
MKYEHGTPPDMHTGGTKDPTTRSPLNLNSLVLEQELRDVIEVHCRFHGTAVDLAGLVDSGYPNGQTLPIIQAWERLGSDFLEEIQILISGQPHYTKRRLDYLRENATDFSLNLYQITQALTLLGYPAKYDTIKKWAQRGHLSRGLDGTFTLAQAIERIEQHAAGN